MIPVSDGDFREELLETLRESDPGEVVVANEAAGSVRTLPEFPANTAEALAGAEAEDLVVLDEAGEHVRTLRESPKPDRMWVADATEELQRFTGNRRQYATLSFAEEHVADILAGEKTVTLRLPDAYDQVVVHAAERGGEVLLVTPDGQPFARAAMRAVWAATARQVCGAALAGYPTELASPDDVLRVLERHYGDELADAGPTEPVDVVHFDVVESYREVSEE